MNKKDEVIMKLVHYFITEENYNPIIVNGVKDEIWLENLNNEYKIVRIVSNYIHNNEQLEYDVFRTKHIAKKIKKNISAQIICHSKQTQSVGTDLMEFYRATSRKRQKEMPFMT